MNCFQVIKTVLDDAYAQIPGASEEKNTAIKEALVRLRSNYASVMQGTSISYSDPSTRFAYLYCYTTSHANMVHHICHTDPTIQALLKQPEVSIAAIGGGPGSDFLGIIKSCEKCGFSPVLRLHLFDRDTSWGESWSDLDKKMPGGIDLRTIFLTFDVTRPETWSHFTKHHSSDLVTMVYFMSEIYSKKADADRYFSNLFSKMKPGALALFVDNNDTRIHGWFDELAAQNGLDVIKSGEGRHQMPSEEEVNDLGEYAKIFESPKLRGDISFRLARKR